MPTPKGQERRKAVTCLLLSFSTWGWLDKGLQRTVVLAGTALSGITGQWLSPQVWAAVVASGWAGLCPEGR